MFVPVLVRVRGEDGALVVLRLGHPLVDAFLAHVRARGRLNSWLAAAFDLKVFFTAIEREPADVMNRPGWGGGWDCWVRVLGVASSVECR